METTTPIQDTMTVEHRGIDFFHLIPDRIEERLENNVDISKWNWN